MCRLVDTFWLYFWLCILVNFKFFREAPFVKPKTVILGKFHDEAYGYLC